MEGSADCEQKNLINELREGKELAKQLQIHLNVSSSTHETRELLVHRILNSYDKALSMLMCSSASANVKREDQQRAQATAIGTTIGMLESPRSFNGSPHSEDSDGDFRHPEQQDTRKRKSMPRWTQQVQVTPGRGPEGPLDDGYIWRKYGQKDILGAKFPRGYYRCTYRNVQGCLATKQVQRSDDDPTIFEITYRGRHTCSNQPQPQPQPQPQGLGSASASTSLTHENQEQPNTFTPDYLLQLIPHIQPHNSQQILFNFRTGLEVKTEDLDSRDNQAFTSFYVPNPTSNIGNEAYGARSSVLENEFGGAFISPTSSGSNYFSISPATSTGTINVSGNEGTQNWHTSESEIAGLVIPAASTSVTDTTPSVGLDNPLGQVEFDSNFSFDKPGPGQDPSFF